MSEECNNSQPAILKKFQFILIDEKKTHISYPGVEDKGPRPYLVVRSNIHGKGFMACPITSVESVQKTSKKKRKSFLEIDYDGEPSYVLMHLPLAFRTTIIDDGIVTIIDKHLNKSLRNVAIRLLKESFDD